MPEAPHVRRRQEDRTAETRESLFRATVRVVFRSGYAAASTALIAADAGVSRGAILHQFGTRAQLMAETVRWVYDREREDYAKLQASRHLGARVSDWPELLWEVLSKPPGFAVLEILWATRSDPELADRVLPIQAEIEQAAYEAMYSQLGGDRARHLASMRLQVWAIRGLTLAHALVPDPEAVRDSVDLLRRILEHAAPSGSINDVYEPARRALVRSGAGQ